MILSFQHFWKGLVKSIDNFTCIPTFSTNIQNHQFSFLVSLGIYFFAELQLTSIITDLKSITKINSLRFHNSRSKYVWTCPVVSLIYNVFSWFGFFKSCSCVPTVFPPFSNLFLIWRPNYGKSGYRKLFFLFSTLDNVNYAKSHKASFSPTQDGGCRCD